VQVVVLDARTDAVVGELVAELAEPRCERRERRPLGRVRAALVI
jgi:hypothetical protein